MVSAPALYRASVSSTSTSPARSSPASVCRVRTALGYGEGSGAERVAAKPPVPEARPARLQRRAAHPDEMVGPALFLASDAASFVTGQVVIADGGLVPG